MNDNDLLINMATINMILSIVIIGRLIYEMYKNNYDNRN